MTRCFHIWRPVRHNTKTFIQLFGRVCQSAHTKLMTRVWRGSGEVDALLRALSHNDLGARKRQNAPDEPTPPASVHFSVPAAPNCRGRHIDGDPAPKPSSMILKRRPRLPALPGPGRAL